MKAFIFLKNSIPIFLAFLLFFVAYTLNVSLNKPVIVVSKQDETWNINDEMIQKFNLGFKRLESSFLWISTILESDIEHYKKRDLNSWMFLRFNTISKLEPKFYENYAFGGPYLSIVKDDLEGASIIYEKGINQFPNDYSLLRDAGFHFQFEVGDYKKSYEIYSRLKNNPKSNLLILSTLARLESSQGNLEGAFELLSAKYEEVKDKETYFAQRIFNHLYSIRAEIDLDCLNNKKAGCHIKDLEGNPYLKNSSGLYTAGKSWEVFRVKRKASPSK